MCGGLEACLGERTFRRVGSWRVAATVALCSVYWHDWEKLLRVEADVGWQAVAEKRGWIAFALMSDEVRSVRPLALSQLEYPTL